MDLVTCHGILARLPAKDRPMLPVEGVVLGAGVGPKLDVWPPLAAALVSLSGMLEEAEPGDLVEAMAHGAALLSAEVISLDDVAEEADRVIAAVRAWGDQQAAHQRRRR